MAKKKLRAKPAPKKRSPKRTDAQGASAVGGPLSLAQAKALVQAQAPLPATAQVASVPQRAATHKSVAKERKELDRQVAKENERRTREYKAVMSLLKARGIKGLTPAATAVPPPGAAAPAAVAAPPIQIFSEGDSWFDYPVPLFGGGIIPRLEKRLGVPILSLAKAGDEVRSMLGVSEQKVLIDRLQDGSPAGGPWDVLLFSGGGNDIVGDQMALWIQNFQANVPPPNLISASRFAAALTLVRSGYEDLIQLRDTLSPSTHLVFHGYDFAIPDGRGVCFFMGPWLKPTFDLRRFPSRASAVAVVKAMLQQFAGMLTALAASHSRVTFINTQGTLAPHTNSWHNELHPSSAGFNKMADLFHANLKTLFPGRVL